MLEKYAQANKISREGPCLGFAVLGWPQICGQLLTASFICSQRFRKLVRLWFYSRHKSLWPYGCSGTRFTAVANCTNQKTGIQSEIIETQIFEIQIQFAAKQIFPLCQQFVCLRLIDLAPNCQLFRLLQLKIHVEKSIKAQKCVATTNA